MQVGEDSLWDALYQVVVQAQGVDADQQGYGVPGDVHQVVVAQVQILQGLQEVLREREGVGWAGTQAVRKSNIELELKAVSFNCLKYHCVRKRNEGRRTELDI